MFRPLVSILIPAFNAQEWIAETLRSAVAQTWEPKEIIVVDDGSTDNTFSIAQNFESNTLRIFRQQNQGAAAARNQAFQLSRGEYIQWLDADDLLAPDKIALQMNALASNSRRTVASCSWGRFMYRAHKARFVSSMLWCDLAPTEWLARRMERNLYMQTATWLVSRELSELAGPWDTRLLGDDDNEYFCRVLLASDRVRFVSQARVYYRAFGYGTLSYVGRSDLKIDAHWLSMRLQIHHLRSHHDNEKVRIACVKYLENWLHYFYPERMDIVREAELLAAKMGGRLNLPRLSWKYAWIRSMLGWRMVKPVQLPLKRARRKLERAIDKLFFRLQYHLGPATSVWGNVVQFLTENKALK
jgi:glycosyltransferase involved in cell wall biosynthesis